MTKIEQVDATTFTDWMEQLQEAYVYAVAATAGCPATKVGRATRIEPSFAEGQTAIRDPRERTKGSPEARQAVAICKAPVAFLKSEGDGSPSLRVNEATFAYSSNDVRLEDHGVLAPLVSLSAGGLRSLANCRPYVSPARS